MSKIHVFPVLHNQLYSLCVESFAPEKNHMHSEVLMQEKAFSQRRDTTHMSFLFIFYISMYIVHLFYKKSDKSSFI